MKKCLDSKDGKHNWRQRFKTGHQTIKPDGYYCIHCRMKIEEGD